MNAVEITNINEVEPYRGPHAIPGIRFRSVGEALGVTAWGMNVIQLDPGAEGYPEHDHSGDGQQEVYIVLDGSLMLRTAGGDVTLTKGDMARVAPDVTRKFVTAEAGATLLALGGTPSKAYEPPAWS